MEFYKLKNPIPSSTMLSRCFTARMIAPLHKIDGIIMKENLMDLSKQHTKKWSMNKNESVREKETNKIRQEFEKKQIT